MLVWGFGGNAMKRYMYGEVELIELPWWLWLIEKFADCGCSYIPPIPFPDFRKKTWKDSEGEKSTPKEWYGNLQQFYCSHVCGELAVYLHSHPKRKVYTINLGYEKLKEILYYHDPTYFIEMDERCKEYDAEEKADDVGATNNKTNI